MKNLFKCRKGTQRVMGQNEKKQIFELQAQTRERTQINGIAQIANKIIELSQTKEQHTYTDTRRTQNTKQTKTKVKITMVYCQNAKFTEQRKSIENLKKKRHKLHTKGNTSE